MLYLYVALPLCMRVKLLDKLRGSKELHTERKKATITSAKSFEDEAARGR